ncbi:MAG TPA: hypothetical protein VFQ82_12000, partial [Stellaceae bacterium]|nr:hypothetical protein [Stellaceae bacterium]
MLLGLVPGLAAGPAALAQAPMPTICTDQKVKPGEPPKPGVLPAQPILMGGVGAPQQPDLEVTGACIVDTAKKYFYGNVNILNGGSLEFEQPTAAFASPNIDFWAKSIVVEAGGALTAGATRPYGDPGTRLLKDGGFLTIHLYGENQSVDEKTGKPADPVKMPGQGVPCKSSLTKDSNGDPVPCGIPAAVWQSNGSELLPGCSAGNPTSCIPGLPAETKDYFYQYGPLYGDSKCEKGGEYQVKNGKAMCGNEPAAGRVGYFGYKVLAVSYGGTLMLRGYKGTSAADLDKDPLASGNSWMRLEGDLKPGDTTLTVDGLPAEQWWRPNDRDRDQIVVTTTDYLPGHSEELAITFAQGNKVILKQPIKWLHNGERFKINLGDAKNRLEKAGMDPKLVANGAETRAAVALLTRSIRIVSEGDFAGETYQEASDRTVCPDGKTKGCYYFGGHT